MTGPMYKVKPGLVGLNVDNMDDAASGPPPPDPFEDGTSMEALPPTRTKGHVTSEMSSAKATASSSRSAVDAATKTELAQGAKTKKMN